MSAYYHWYHRHLHTPQDSVIRLYVKIADDFMRFIIQDRFRFVHEIFNSMVKLLVLAQFSVDPLSTHILCVCRSFCPKAFLLDLIIVSLLFLYPFLKNILIIMSRYQHGYPWTSLATLPHRPLLPAGPSGYIPYRHRVAACRFELVVLPLHVHVKGFTGVHHMISFLLLQQCSSCLVCLILIFFVMRGRGPYSCCFVGGISRTCSILLTSFLCSCRQAFSPSV